MKSLAWKHFLAQYEATGREALDGYDASHFEGLTPTERTEAGALVISRARRGHTSEILALALLATPGARQVVDDLWASEGASSLVRIAVCQSGWSLSGEARYQEALLPFLETNDDFVRTQAHTAIGAMRLTPAAYRDVRGRLATERDPTRATQLAKAVLGAHGVDVESMEHFMDEIERIRALTDPNLTARATALTRLDAEHPRTDGAPPVRQ